MNNFKEKLNSFFLLDDEMEPVGAPVEEAQIPSKPVQKQTAPQVAAPSIKKEAPKMETKIQRKSGGENVVAINQKQAIQKPQITIIEPRLYSEVQEVADYVLSNQTVIVNFRRMDREQATKMIDFMMGLAYAVKGDIQRLDEELFICTPQSVTVNGSELSEYANSLL